MVMISTSALNSMLQPLGLYVYVLSVFLLEKNIPERNDIRTIIRAHVMLLFFI